MLPSFLKVSIYSGIVLNSSSQNPFLKYHYCILKYSKMCNGIIPSSGKHQLPYLDIDTSQSFPCYHNVFGGLHSPLGTLYFASLPYIACAASEHPFLLSSPFCFLSYFYQCKLSALNFFFYCASLRWSNSSIPIIQELIMQFCARLIIKKVLFWRFTCHRYPSLPS